MLSRLQISTHRYSQVTTVALAALILIVLTGSAVRLTASGLGCPDWPGCYGHLVLPADEAVRSSAQTAWPERPIEAGKAWREMVHRYAASSLGLVIVLASFCAWLNRRDPRQPVILPAVLLGVVIFQGLLGMWTVTLLLKPLIVMGHLLGGRLAAAATATPAASLNNPAIPDGCGGVASPSTGLPLRTD